MIVWLTWKLLGKKEPKRFRCTDLRPGCTDLRPEAKEDSEKGKQSEKAKEQKKSQEAREDEPALNTEQGSLKENELRLQERESLRENEPKLSKCRRLMTVKEIPPSESSPEKVGLGAINGHFGKPQGWIRGRKAVGEIVNKGRRRSQPLEVPEVVDRDSFFYHCPTGCPKPPPMKVRAVAMVSEEGNVIKMAMLRGSMHPRRFGTRRTTLEVNGVCGTTKSQKGCVGSVSTGWSVDG